MGEPVLPLTRRGAIAGLGAAIGGLAISGRVMGAVPTGLGLYKIVYDAREPEGRAFGAHFAAAGLKTETVADDPTWLWFDDLHHRWQGAAVAGLTTPEVALSLKLVAELAGLRAVIWGRHAIGPSGRASHLITAPEPGLAAWKRQGDACPAWAGAVRDMIVATAAQPAPYVRLTHSSGAPEHDARQMVSWLLAPVSRGSV